MNDLRTFLTKLGATVGIVTLVIVTLFVLWKAAQVFLLAFAGLLFAVVLTSMSQPLARVLHLPYRLALSISVLLLVALFTGMVLLVGPQLGDQLTELGETVPGSVAAVRERLAQNPWGQWLLDALPMPGAPGAEGDAAGAESAQAPPPGLDLIGQLRGLFGGILGAFAGLFFILFSGLFLAGNPKGYVDGIVHLFPSNRQDRAREVFATLGATLRGWLLGQLLSMIVVGVLVAIALSIIGVPLVLALAFLAFLFEFIPTIGPWLGAIPAVLLALAEGADKALLVAAVYLAIQMVEGNVIHPLAQLRTVDLPPFVTIFAIFLMERLFGFPGVLVASPLAAVVMVLVRQLYMRDELHQHVHLPGEASSEAPPPGTGAKTGS